MIINVQRNCNVRIADSKIDIMLIVFEKNLSHNCLFTLLYSFLAVTAIEDRLSYDVEVELCYCDKDECNAGRPNSAKSLSLNVYTYISLSLSFLCKMYQMI